MGFFKIFASAAVLCSLIPTPFAFDTDLKSNVAVYYGQGPDQLRLAHFCQETSLDIVNLGFVNSFPAVVGQWPGSNFGNQCDGSYYLGSTLLSGCHQIWEDIPVCQALGKKVFLSVGGDSAYPIPLTDDVAEWFADFLWYSFGPNQANTRYEVGLFDNYVKDIFPRPFQNVSVDGFDFDVEHNGGLGYAAMINRLRSRFDESPDRKFYISGSPQCPLPDAQLSDAIQNSAFDFIWVQFYNSQGCSAANYANGTGSFNFGDWVDVIKKSSNPSAKLYVGLPASEDAAIAGYYITPSQAKSLVEKYINLYPETFGGIMLWEATSAENNIVDGQDYFQHMKRILYEYAPLPKPTATPTPTHTVVSTPTHVSHSSSSVHSSDLPTLGSSASSSLSTLSTAPIVKSSSATSSLSSAVVSPSSSVFSSAAFSPSSSVVSPSSAVVSPGSSVVSSSATQPSRQSSILSSILSSVAESSSTPSPLASVSASSSSKKSPFSSSSKVKSSSIIATSSWSVVSSSTQSNSETTTPATSSHGSANVNTQNTSSTGRIITPNQSSVSTSTILVVPTPVSSSSIGIDSSFFSFIGNPTGTPLGSNGPPSSSTAIHSPTSTSDTRSDSTTLSSGTSTRVQFQTSIAQTTLSHSTAISQSLSSPTSSIRRPSTQTRSINPSNTSKTGVPTVTSYVTAAPSVTPSSFSSQLETITTVIVTSYTSICPTGFTTITTTYTTYFCPEASATATATPGVTSPVSGEAMTTPIPEGWTTTVTVCNHCAATPTTVTLTLPNPTTTGEVTSAAISDTTVLATTKSAMVGTSEEWTTTVTVCKQCGPTGSTLTLTVPHTPAASTPASNPTDSSDEASGPSGSFKTTVTKPTAVASGSPTSKSRIVGTGVGGAHPVGQGQSQSQSKSFALHPSTTNSAFGHSPVATGTQTQTGTSSTYTGAGSRSVIGNLFGVTLAAFMSLVVLV